MYCPSCGARNQDDARFCNMCGSKITAPPSVQKPTAQATRVGVGPFSAPSESQNARSTAVQSAKQEPVNAWAVSSHGNESERADSAAFESAAQRAWASTGSVSLQGIGVQSSKRVWVIIGASAFGLMALGAGGMWLAMHNQAQAGEDTGAKAEDPFVIGSPLPKPSSSPGSSASSVVKDEASSAKTPSAGEGSKHEGKGRAVPKEHSAHHEAVRTRTKGSASSGVENVPAGRIDTTSHETEDTTLTRAQEAATPTDSPPNPSPSGSEEPSPSSEEQAPGSASSSQGETPEERDIQMEMYSGRVRYVVRRYYASRAQTCFERATRNRPELHGTVVISLTIGSDGAVKNASVARNTTGDEDLGGCLAGQVRSWKLPPPDGGELEMEMPFSR